MRAELARDRHARAPGRARGCPEALASAPVMRASSPIVTIGTGIDSCRRRSRSPTRTTASPPRSGSTRTRPADRRPAAWASCASCSPIRRRWPSVRRASTTTTAPTAGRAAGLFDAQLALAAELGLPVVVHSRRRAPTRPRCSRGFDGRSSCTASRSRSSSSRARARLVRLVRRQRHVPEGAGAPRRGRRVPADRILAETDSPYLAPQPVRGRPNEPAYVAHTLAALADGPRRGCRASWRPGSTRTRPRVRRCVSRRPKKRARAALPGRREHPRRHRAPGRAGSGRRRARDRAGPRRAHPLPRRPRRACPRGRARPVARAALSPTSPREPNVDLHWGDALTLDLAALEPAPTKLVANLPYNVATPIVAESLDGLPTLELWT